MRLWIIRHGKADQESPTGRDEHRLLRDRGRRQAEWLGVALRDSDAPPSLILSSGLLRAIETARIIQDSLGCPLLVEPALETGHAAEDALRLVTSHADADSLAVVGHNPQLESLAGMLVRSDTVATPGIRTGQALELALTLASNGAPFASLVRSLRADESAFAT